MTDTPRDFDLQSYHLEVPESLIAQYPSEKRGDSRLMVLYKDSGHWVHTSFARLADYLPQGACLVANNSKVFPARLGGRKKATGAWLQVLLTTPLPLLQPRELSHGWREAEASALIRPAKRIRPGHGISLGGDLEFQVEDKHSYGRVEGRLHWRGELSGLLEQAGRMPLPPYIRREQEAIDRERYQTVFARESRKGSAASPTAGLHFSPQTIRELQGEGITWTEISLHVGYGTFTPLREQDIRNHRMHAEYVEIPPESAEKVNRAKQEARPVVAVGTTSTRALETAACPGGGITAYQGWSDLYIYPGYSFQVVDHLITNFHLPGSSLILMVSALAGRQQLLRAYKNAIQERYRFFSYGDAMLIL